MSDAPAVQTRRGVGMHVKPVPKPEVAKSYDGCRRALHEVLKGFCFARITSVSQPPPRPGAEGTIFFHCEALEVFPTLEAGKRAASEPRIFYFDKFMRSKTNTVSLGAASVVDTPLGGHHISCVPNLGDIVMGTPMANTKPKARVPMVLINWINNASPVMHLARMVKFGTRCTEAEIREKLQQPASLFAERVLSSTAASTIDGVSKRAAELAKAARDDLWALARLILYGNIPLFVTLHEQEEHGADPSGRLLAISMRAKAFVELTSFRLKGDMDMVVDFLAAVPQAATGSITNTNTSALSTSLTTSLTTSVYQTLYAATAPAAPASSPYGGGQAAAANPYPYSYGSVGAGFATYPGVGVATYPGAGATTYPGGGGGGSYVPSSPPASPLALPYGAKTPPLGPSTPPFSNSLGPSTPPLGDYGAVAGNKTPTYAPSSPCYAPSSPTYAPGSMEDY